MSSVEHAERRLPDNVSDDAPKLLHVKSPLYGELPAPETLGELLAYVESVSWAYAGFAGWRGQAEIDWRLDSTAARRLFNHQSSWPEDMTEWEPLERLVRNYEGRLLEQTRMAGHGFRDGREFTDLELLSVLQHYGAATRLLDFSRNVFVALWFACRSRPDSWGLLMGIEENKRRV